MRQLHYPVTQLPQGFSIREDGLGLIFQCFLKFAIMGQAGQNIATDSSPPSSDKHVLLTVLGTNPRPTCYELEGRPSEAELAPMALLDLLQDSDKPSRVLALCTPEAERESLSVLKDSLGDRYTLEPVPIFASGSPEKQVNGYLEPVTNAVGSSDKVTVDVTHGFRHFSFLMYVSVFYLAALYNIKMCEVYYDLLSNDGSPSPFIDLQPLLKLPDWIYALKVIEEMEHPAAG